MKVIMQDVLASFSGGRFVTLDINKIDRRKNSGCIKEQPDPVPLLDSPLLTTIYYPEARGAVRRKIISE